MNVILLQPQYAKLDTKRNIEKNFKPMNSKLIRAPFGPFDYYELDGTTVVFISKIKNSNSQHILVTSTLSHEQWQELFGEQRAKRIADGTWNDIPSTEHVLFLLDEDDVKNKLADTYDIDCDIINVLYPDDACV